MLTSVDKITKKIYKENLYSMKFMQIGYPIISSHFPLSLISSQVLPLKVRMNSMMVPSSELSPEIVPTFRFRSHKTTLTLFIFAIYPITFLPFSSAFHPVPYFIPGFIVSSRFSSSVDDVLGGT